MSRLRPASLVATAAAVLVSLTTPADAATTPGLPQTTITFSVRDCNGCVIHPIHATLGYFRPVGVRRGVAVLRVPTRATRGMTFMIAGPGDAVSNSEPMLAVRYDGVRPGTLVSASRAAAGKRATACWVGTTKPSAHIWIRAAHFADVGADGVTPMTSLRTWATPALASTRAPMEDTDHGAIGAQSTIFC